jgi:hypothetical protein
MTGGTKGGAQRARSLRPRCFGEVDPETATPIYLSIYLSIYTVLQAVTLYVPHIHMYSNAAQQRFISQNWIISLAVRMVMLQTVFSF